MHIQENWGRKKWSWCTTKIHSFKLTPKSRSESWFGQPWHFAMIPNQTEYGPIKGIPGQIWSVKLCEHIKWKIWNEKLSQFRMINVQNQFCSIKKLFLGQYFHWQSNSICIRHRHPRPNFVCSTMYTSQSKKFEGKNGINTSWYKSRIHPTTLKSTF
jgi:hypothetical protein